MQKCILIGMMTVMLVTTGFAGGVAVSPVVVAEEGNGKVTLRYDLALTETSPRARPDGAVRAPAAGPLLDWDQQALCNSSTGATEISGTNPNGNGSLRLTGGCTSGRLSWMSNIYAWRIPSSNAFVDYYNIDLTGYQSCTSAEVDACVAAKGGHAGPWLSLNGTGYTYGNVGSSWSVVSHTFSSGTLNWGGSDNEATVTRTTSSTDTLAVGFVSIYIYGAVPVQPATITVTSPNGGEYWKNGEIKPITWSWTGNISSVDVARSSDGGATWHTVWTGLSNDGTQDWGIDVTPSAQCRIKISDHSNSSVNDMSNANFKIANQISVNSPNGGEQWFVGSSKTVTWNTTGISGATVYIAYSTDGGTNWASLVTSTSDNGSCSVTAPDAPSSHARIKVADRSTNINAGSSAADFAIMRQIRVNSPNGGETWVIGSTRTITWSASGMPDALVDIGLSRTGGPSPSGIIAGASDNGSHTWTVTGPTTTQGRIVIYVRNYSNNDMSDANFTIWTSTGAEEHTSLTPARTELLQTSPEPFRTRTSISFALAEKRRVSLIVYGIDGTSLWGLDKNLPAGRHTVLWDGRDRNGNRVPKGIYFCCMRTSDYSATRKMVKTH